MTEHSFASLLKLLPIFILLVFLKGCFCLSFSYEGCAPKHCGDGKNVSYPFYIDGLQDPDCGYPDMKLSCKNGSSVLQLSGNKDYLVEHIDYDNHTIRLLNSQIISCPSAITNLTFDKGLFTIKQFFESHLVFLMKCSKELPKNLTRYRINGSSCDAGDINQLVMKSYDQNLNIGKEVCSNVVVAPVELQDGEGNKVVDGTNYREVVKGGFAISWYDLDCSSCQQSGGRCGNGYTFHRITCLFPDNSSAYPFNPKDNRGMETTDVATVAGTTTRTSKKHMAAITAAIVGVVMILVTFMIFCLIKKLKQKRKRKSNVNVDNFLKNHEFLAPKKYSYSQVKKMTNSFKVKLGQGGFGSVYKGELCNENLVAVKVLNELKGNGEDFINEVASVGRTSHVNIVTLVGFCCDGHHRALIYEFMPNGSLERFIYGRECSGDVQLGWEKLHQIAIGIARGLEYLHKGCNTRILHFDIKPHNILLDQDLCPKISDFGLAKLLHEKRSMTSLSHMRGTPGYIAPELISRNFGQISHKSDVYSYGMMILEIFGGRKNMEVIDHTSDYFPYWLYKKLELHEEQLGLHGIVRDVENEIVRKMIIVGLWCIQTNPMNRPMITKVLEMLHGDIASLKIPPKPYFSSPTRSIDPLSIDKLNHNCSFTVGSPL